MTKDKWVRVEPHLGYILHQSKAGEWSKRYYVRFTDWKGVRRKFAVGPTLRAARQQKSFYLTENGRRVDFGQRPAKKMTFNAWADRYLEIAGDLTTQKERHDMLDLHIRPVFGSLLVEDISYVTIKQFADQLAKTPKQGQSNETLSPARCNRYLALLRRVLRTAWQENIIEKVPHFQMFQEDNDRDTIYTESEFEKLYAAAAPHIQPILICARETGMRRGEITGLTWDQVDLQANVIRLKSTDTKTKRKRAIPISDILRQLLVEIRTTSGKIANIHRHVFLRKGRPIKSFYTAFVGARTRAGLDGKWFHDTRRSFATRKIEEGWDRDLVKAITGHRTDTVFSRYNKPSDEHLSRVVNGPQHLPEKQISAK